MSTDLVIEKVPMRSVKNKGGFTRARGVAESVIATCVNSMHQCFAVHQMSKLENVKHVTSAYQIEVMPSRQIKDNRDFEMLMQ